MDNDDPFFSPKQDDRTVLKPMPGGRRADLRNLPPRSNNSVAVSGEPLPKLGTLNPLESAASGLLALITRLNNVASHPDPVGLKNQLSQEIKIFQDEAFHKGIEQNTVHTARYVLCTTLDEAVLNTPWGHASGWAQQSLLSHFHKEVSGGEQFFKILKSLGKNPTKNKDLLELMYLCLALGFEGRYRITEGGKDKLIKIRDWLYRLISRERSASEHQLSPHWQGVIDKRHPLLRFVPLWVISAIAAALLAALFMALLMHLNHLSDPVFKQVFSMKAMVAQVPAAPSKPPPLINKETEPVITLSKLLAQEIKMGEIRVSESEKESKVTLRGDSLFRSGRANINEGVIPLLKRVGESLNQLPGAVLITGHSDSDPIKNARFPSNWHLSQVRADAVAEIISNNLDEPSRVTVEGRADLEPVVANDTLNNKARNRRVEIMLFH
jgi:type VI secretion system protein ImpK